MNGTIYISGEIGVETTLLDVIKQVKAQSHAESFLVKIDSNGGYVDAGFDIYNYLQNLGKPVTTFTTRAYSIASIIFMAGSVRIIPENAVEALMIHLPWMEVAGDQQTLSDYAKDLKSTEDDLVDFYSKAIEIDNRTIHSLLKNETFLNATQAKELGFATILQVAQKAVAKLHNKEDKVQETLMNKLTKKLDAIYNKVMGIKAELILQDSTGVELVFPELEASDAPTVDSQITVDGKPAEGEYLMPNGEILVVTGGVLTDIKPIEEPTEDGEIVDAEGDELPTDDKEAKIGELEAKIAELEAKLEDLLPNASAEKLLDALSASMEKQEELETKFQALAKSIGSDFTSKNDNETTSATAMAKKVETPKFSIKRK